jgi:alpha-tubulin suppressor-like RCC1 family protein
MNPSTPARPHVAVVTRPFRFSSRARVLTLTVQAMAFAVALGCGKEQVTPPITADIASITINGASFAIERGFHRTLTATVRTKAGDTTIVPVVWRSLNEKVATVSATGRVTALDTGVTTIVASTLGVSSAPIGVRVVWQGAAAIATKAFTPPAAVSPGAVLPDSLHALVTDLAGSPVPGARVLFTSVAGGAHVSPDTVVTDRNGIASAALTLGTAFGRNAITATVLDDDGQPLSFVKGNGATFALTTFAALVTVAGDAQTGLILSPLPVSPSVRVVDSLGNPRPGVPVTFTPTSGGTVTTMVVSTDASGLASPGTWTLGDATGNQSLVVTVEAATLTLRATATGTAIHFFADQVVAGGFATCGRIADGTAQCFGQQPRVGDGTTTDRSKPTPTAGGIHFSVLSSSPTHFCGIAIDASIYCWGSYALVDTSGRTVDAAVPTRLPSAVSWASVAPGQVHNCALARDRTAYCWGDNSVGQLGDRSTTLRFAPAVVAGGFQFASLASGAYHSCGLTSDGSAFCWGFNQNGQLGDGTTANRTAPTAVTGSISFQSLGGGQSLTCGLSAAGKAYCWGNISAANPMQLTPRAYPTAPLFTTLSVGAAHACGLTADGTAYCWGNNSLGQLGDSTTTDRVDPTPVAGGLKFQSISAGFGHTCARTSDGAVACWGSNRAGELGDSTSSFHLTPRYVVLGVTP